MPLTRGCEQRDDPRSLPPADRLDGPVHQAPVAADERHGIGDRRQPCEVNALIGSGHEQSLIVHGNGPDDIEDHTGRRGEGVHAAAEGRVGNYPGRPLTTREVVVEHHDIQTQLDRALEGVHARCSAVDACEHPGAPVGEALDGLDGYAIAIGEATGQEGGDRTPARPEGTREDRGGAHTVAVVVTVDRDVLPPVERLPETHRGLLHAGNGTGVAQRAVRGEELACRVRVGEPTPGQDPRHGLRTTESLLKALHVLKRHATRAPRGFRGTVSRGGGRRIAQPGRS